MYNPAVIIAFENVQGTCKSNECWIYSSLENLNIPLYILCGDTHLFYAEYHFSISLGEFKK